MIHVNRGGQTFMKKAESVCGMLQLHTKTTVIQGVTGGKDVFLPYYFATGGVHIMEIKNCHRTVLYIDDGFGSIIILTVCINLENREKCIISRLTLESRINIGATFIIF